MDNISKFCNHHVRHSIKSFDNIFTATIIYFIALIYLMYFVLISVQKINNIYLRNKFNIWSVHGIMNTSGLLQSK